MTQIAEVTHESVQEWQELKLKDRAKSVSLEQFLERVEEESASNLGDKVDGD